MAALLSVGAWAADDLTLNASETVAFGDWEATANPDGCSITITSAVVKANTGEAGNVSLSVSDMQYDWGGWGGSADATENSSTGDSWQELTGNCLSAPNGNHTVYLILSGDVRLDKWVIGEGSLTGISTIQVNSSKVNDDHVIYSLSGQRVNKPVKGVNIVRSTDGCMRKKVFK